MASSVIVEANFFVTCMGSQSPLFVNIIACYYDIVFGRHP